MKLSAGLWKRFKKFREQNDNTVTAVQSKKVENKGAESITDFVER